MNINFLVIAGLTLQIVKSIPSVNLYSGNNEELNTAAIIIP